MPGQTLAQLVRAKHPGAYDDLSDEQLESAVRAKYPGVYDDLPRTTPAQMPPPMKPVASHGDPTAGEQMRSVLKWGGNVIAGMTGMGEAGREAVENPGTALATAAVPPVVKGVMKGVSAIPTRAKAAAKFQQVMGKVGDRPVDVARPGDAALRVYQLSERGGTMPKSVRDFLKRVTDPAKGEPTYREMRDFYSNISRLSADEMKRLQPVVRKEVGELRVALNKALADTAAKGGQERVYREAMREYTIASRLRELSEKAAKYGAGIAGAGTAYNMLKN